jgi:hypothetical protein
MAGAPVLDESHARTAQVPVLNLVVFFHAPAGNGVEPQLDASELAG